MGIAGSVDDGAAQEVGVAVIGMSEELDTSSLGGSGDFAVSVSVDDWVA